MICTSMVPSRLTPAAISQSKFDAFLYSTKITTAYLKVWSENNNIRTIAL